MKKPSFAEAFFFWLKLGFISFGGPAGQIAIMHEFLVEKKKWISESRFLHALNYTMLLPGPEAQQLATYSGWLLHGVKGGLIAGILFILPSMFILLALSSIYVTFGSIPWIYALFQGLKPAIVAIIVLALIKIGKKSLQHALHYFLAMGSFIAMFVFNIPFPTIIISSFLIYFIIKKFAPSFIDHQDSKINIHLEDESQYFINHHSVLPQSAMTLSNLVKHFALFILIWSIPLFLFSVYANDFDFWKSLILFFSKASLVTFGGAYAVLPYVAQISVEEFAWLSNFEMMDGLALGETTPGPLVMVLVFVGFMAGYHHFESSLLMGTIGLFTTTFITFVPCFFFIFAGAPLIEKTRENATIKDALSLVTAAVVGVILNLTIYLGQAILFPNQMSFEGFDWLNSIWIGISLIALDKFKLNLILWIGISALFGLARWLFFN